VALVRSRRSQRVEEDVSELETAIAHIDAVSDADQQVYRRMIELAENHPDALVRTCRPGHFTGSAVVIDPATERFLLMFHSKLQLWLQPGGHADGEGNLAAVALREATEETGIHGLTVIEPAVDLDIHRVDPPKEDAHEHFDVRFLVLAPAGAREQGNEESEELRWVDLAELDTLVPDDNSRRMARAALATLWSITA
jgi:8-oxo-dGTP pyrophosphatase MutT (NUDIX family)